MNINLYRLPYSTTCAGISIIGSITHSSLCNIRIISGLSFSLAALSDRFVQRSVILSHIDTAFLLALSLPPYTTTYLSHPSMPSYIPPSAPIRSPPLRSMIDVLTTAASMWGSVRPTWIVGHAGDNVFHLVHGGRSAVLHPTAVPGEKGQMRSTTSST